MVPNLQAEITLCVPSTFGYLHEGPQSRTRRSREPHLSYKGFCGSCSTLMYHARGSERHSNKHLKYIANALRKYGLEQNQIYTHYYSTSHIVRSITDLKANGQKEISVNYAHLNIMKEGTFELDNEEIMKGL